MTGRNMLEMDWLLDQQEEFYKFHGPNALENQGKNKMGHQQTARKKANHGDQGGQLKVGQAADRVPGGTTSGVPRAKTH